MRMPFRRTGTDKSSLPSLKSCALFGSADQPTRQRPRLHATLLIQLAEMGHGLLNDPTADTDAAHQTPIAVDLPVLLANRVAQIHAPSQPAKQQKKTPLVVTTRPNALRSDPQLLDPSRPLRQIDP